MAARKRGPKPTLRKATRVTVMLEGNQLRAVDAFAKRSGVNRSESVRRQIARGLAADDLFAVCRLAVENEEKADAMRDTGAAAADLSRHLQTLRVIATAARAALAKAGS